jgi:hypothetical protein
MLNLSCPVVSRAGIGAGMVGQNPWTSEFVFGGRKGGLRYKPPPYGQFRPIGTKQILVIIFHVFVLFFFWFVCFVQSVCCRLMFSLRQVK